MTAAILSIGTAVPGRAVAQTRIRDLLLAQPGLDRLTARLVRSVFDASAIDTRHTVIGALEEPDGVFFDDAFRLNRVSTRVRNDIFRAQAPGLFAEAAAGALARADVEAAQITHVVTASCTGSFTPGPDFRLVKDLGLPAGTERYHLGFMGCSAAFPALRTAARICAAQPDAVVLVACAELCSLHIHASADPDQIVSSAVFADGAAAAVVSARQATRPTAQPRLELGDFTTALTSEGEGDMDWSIGDEGFDMVLTAEVPRIVGREIRTVIGAALPGVDAAEAVDAWAIHPGGRSILDRVQSGLGLEDAALRPSREVLRDYGNMSSATVMFILERILQDDDLPGDADVLGIAFGPGLTVETARFTRRSA